MRRIVLWKASNAEIGLGRETRAKESKGAEAGILAEELQQRNDTRNISPAEVDMTQRQQRPTTLMMLLPDLAEGTSTEQRHERSWRLNVLMRFPCAAQTANSDAESTSGFSGDASKSSRLAEWRNSNEIEVDDCGEKRTRNM